ncbi:hypothetical protein [Nocardioides sp. Kera G14]|uniref:hypothetical protein n=1 Tax=Nocardioides sp. Kera G14 TaxID=2884264 RepID=UPI001D11C5DA|nr:hypothetical protein [Nocardioides sp. Kera G14]UDY22393.1 hypothetical protein LH076_09905 [Nocardioides sp. Kera G14]
MTTTNPTTTTATAQRRLLEAFVDLENNTPGGIYGLCFVGMPHAIKTAQDAGQPEMAAVWLSLAELGAAVYNDMKGSTDDQ